MRLSHKYITAVLSITAALISSGCSPPQPGASVPNVENSHAHTSNASGGSILAPTDRRPLQITNDQLTTRADNSKFPQVPPNEVRLLAWNVESGGNDPAVISVQLAEFIGYDVICLSEVSQHSFERYSSALANQYHEVHGKTGRADRLQIFVKKARYELLDSKELTQHRRHILNTGNHRSPLFVRIQDRNSSQQMIVMTNHLARGNADFRQQQAAGLREWARDQDVPVIALGDFNMDFDYRKMKGNAAFDEMVRDNVWSWLAPETFIDTNWSDRDGDGIDNYPDSMLDLAFAAGAAKEWGIECRVIVRPNDFPDDQTTSDHRPIELIFAR
ncbi:MAG TPA: hypothetical protein DEF45_11785 [Rhodopirellula sp.]|nr:hypothetical protein [Rhodopirellula sp.]